MTRCDDTACPMRGGCARFITPSEVMGQNRARVYPTMFGRTPRLRDTCEQFVMREDGVFGEDLDD